MSGFLWIRAGHSFSTWRTRRWYGWKRYWPKRKEARSRSEAGRAGPGDRSRGAPPFPRGRLRSAGVAAVSSRAEGS